MLQKWFVPLLVAVVAGFSVWMFSQQPEVRPRSVAQDTLTPDSYMANFNSRVFDARGLTKYELTAPHMAHYPHDDHTEFTAPELTMHRSDGERWTMTSESGLASQNNERIDLQGKVVMHQLDTPAGVPGMQIHTRDVLVLPSESYAETEQHALLTRGNDQVEAVGLQAFFEDRRVLLLSEVRGYYAPRP